MNVMCVHGTLYLEEHLSEAKLKEKYVYNIVTSSP
jgi:hypothetical protein